MDGRRNRGSLLILIFLFDHLMKLGGWTHIPPITLLTTLGHVAIHYEDYFLPRPIFPSIEKACISVYHVWTHKQWQRLLYGAFCHFNDMHLYYNMVSFLSKGVMLERQLTSEFFAFMLIVFTFLSGALLVGFNLLLMIVTGNAQYELTCAVGFSAVIFAIKVVLQDQASPHQRQYVFGIPIPLRLMYWSELFIIQMVAPQSSFIGHLSGIVVGLLYTKGPLKPIMYAIFPQVERQNRQPQDEQQEYDTGYSQGYGSPGFGRFGFQRFGPRMGHSPYGRYSNNY